MKNLRKPLVAAAALMLCTGAASALELTTNGGLETGDLTGWTQFPGGGTQTVVTSNPSSGTYALNLNVVGGPTDNVIKQANIGQGIVSAGDEITISFDARGSVGIGGVAFAEFFSEIDGGGVSDAVLLGGAPLALNADEDVWTTFNFTVIAGSDVSGGVTLQLKAGCGAVVDCFADIYFDNASVSVAPVPVPAAVWLFGSALGLLGLRRRKAA